MEAFSLKDMLLSVLAKLDRMEIKLDQKADEAMVLAMDHRLTTVEKIQQAGEMRANILVPQITTMQAQVETLKDQANAYRAVDTYKKWLFVALFSTLISGFLTILVGTGVLRG